MIEKQPLIHNSLIPWHEHYGRHDLPWQQNKSAYTVWVSEIMLQQTQVATVIPYFNKFITSFPTLSALASATQDEVLAHWSGLGYYSRGRNLHRSAQIICQDLGGIFPNTLDELIKLPGIGPSTAAAIMSLAFKTKHAILDGNVKRVLCRFHGITEYPDDPKTKQYLWKLADEHMCAVHPDTYTQAIMDLGATVCTRRNPNCAICPLQHACIAYKNSSYHDIPKPKPKKIKPIKEAYFAVIINEQDEFLLQKRPQKGVWGGLWSFIERETFQDLLNLELIKHYDWIELEDFSHTFTHFKLQIFPIQFQISSEIMLNKDQIWYNPKKENTIGLAKPVSDILNTFSEL